MFNSLEEIKIFLKACKYSQTNSGLYAVEAVPLFGSYRDKFYFLRGKGYISIYKEGPGIISFYLTEKGSDVLKNKNI